MRLTQRRVTRSHKVEPCPVRQVLTQHMTQGELHIAEYSKVLIKMNNIVYNNETGYMCPKMSLRGLSVQHATVICLMTGPLPVPKRALHKLPSNASCLNR